MLRYILVAALMAGIMSGTLLTAIQQIQVTPLIMAAETFESVHSGHTHAADQNSQRLLLSLFANILTGIGFALLIVSAITFSGHQGWRKGLLWGLAGFIIFFAAPSLGLQPKLPGTSSAPLLNQQLWWLATAAATATGIAMLIFSRPHFYKGIGLLLLIIPHLVGAPLPELAYSSAPEVLTQKFILATITANAAFWLILGTLSGYFLRQFDAKT